MTRKQKQQRKKMNNKKKAQEVGAVGKIIRQLGGLGGGALGGMIGAAGPGSALGQSAGAGLSKWLGFGDYKVSSNTLIERASTGIPSMHKTNQSIRITHKEFLGTIQSSINFAVSKEVVLNPGLPSSFPWLSRIADNFQEYDIKGMVFSYIPTSGNAISGTNNALGAVMLQTSYRATETAPTTKSELLNEYWSSEAMPSEAFCHPIECDPKENPFQVHYIRSTDVPDGDSTLLYDYGRTFVCTQGMQANGVTVGDLWVSYDIELKKPMLNSSATSGGFIYAHQSYTTGSPATNNFATIDGPLNGTPGFAAQGFTIQLSRDMVGTFYIYCIMSQPTGITDVAWAGGSTAVNCTTGKLNPSSAGNRIETRITATSLGSTSLVYATMVTKSDNLSPASVTVPTPVASSGHNLTAENQILIYGTPLDI
jgi:hypothetical protein